MSTLELLRSVGYPKEGEFPSTTPVESEEIYEIARNNKIGSLYVKTLQEAEAIDLLKPQWYERKQFQENRQTTYKNFIDILPNTVNFAVVKTELPFWADSSDIDVVLYDNEEGKEIRKIKQALDEQKYDVLGIVPSAMTIEDRETNQLIDIQSDFGLHEVIYFDKETIRSHIKEKTIRDVETPVASMPADLALHVNHSVTELMFTLKEYYAAVYALETFSEAELDTFMEIAEQNCTGTGCSAFFTLVNELSEEAFSTRPKNIDKIFERFGYHPPDANNLRRVWYKMPYKYTNRALLQYTIDKMHQAVFAKSVLREIPQALHPVTGYYLLTKVYDRATRDEYIHT